MCFRFQFAPGIKGGPFFSLLPVGPKSSTSTWLRVAFRSHCSRVNSALSKVVLGYASRNFDQSLVLVLRLGVDDGARLGESLTIHLNIV